MWVLRRDFEPHHLRVTVEGDLFRVETIDRAAAFTADTQVLRSAVVLGPRSPPFREFKGLRYLTPNLALRDELPLRPNPSPETVVIMSTRGNQHWATRVGWFDFSTEGKAVRLEAVRLLKPGVGENDLGISFRDRTTGPRATGWGATSTSPRRRCGDAS